MKLAKFTSHIFISRVLSALIGFGGLAIFAREFDASLLGIYFLFQAVLEILAIPANLGLRGAVVKRISEGQNQNEYFSTVIILKIVALGLPLSILFLFQNQINTYIGKDLVIFLAIGMIIQEFARLSLAVLRAELHLSRVALLRLIRQAIWVTLGWVLIRAEFGINAVVYSHIVGYIVVFVLGCWTCTTSLVRPTLKRAKSLLNYGVYDAIGNISQYTVNWLDVIFIGVFLTSAEVGAYETAWRATIPVVFLSQSIAMTIFPKISEWSASQTQEKIESTISTAFLPSVVLVIPSFFGSLVLSKEILGIVFGTSYGIAWIALIVLTGMRFFQGLQVIFGRTLKGIDRPELAAQSTLIAIFSNILLNVILIPQIGIIGAAIATATSFVVNCIIHYYYTNKILEIIIPYQELLWCVISSLVMAIIVFFVKRSISLNNAPKLFTVILIGAISYSFVLFLFPPLRLKIFNQIRSIM